jgi:uncharacterized membrane protein YtjA (UPF0391 family)
VASFKLLPCFLAVASRVLAILCGIRCLLYGQWSVACPLVGVPKRASVAGTNDAASIRSWILGNRAIVEDRIMLRWALVFFVVALIAAILGFTGIAMAAAGVAKILFFLFVILLALSLLGHVARRPQH